MRRTTTRSPISALLAGVAAMVLTACGPARAGDEEVEIALKIYTKANAPATPKLDDLPLRVNVRQYGITWTFAKPARVGQFVSGDYYVVGPVTVVGIVPKPLFGEDVPESELGKREKERVPRDQCLRNGSMLNPPAKLNVFAYDSGIKSRSYYHPELAAWLPIKMKPGDSLISSISLKVGQKVPTPHKELCYREHHDDSPVRTMAVLTCLAGPVSADAFRPSPFDRKNTIRLARNLRRNLVPSLKPAGTMPPLEKMYRIFQRPWVYTCWFGFDLPIENMPHYGEHLAAAVSLASMTLCCDLTAEQKEPLMVGMVQAGIDLWGTIDAGHPGWCGWGGHHHGPKPLIVLGGILLGDERMANPNKTYPKVEFQEDNQTMYGKGWTGARALFAGHSGIQSASGKPDRPKWGPYEHIHPSKWDENGMRNMQSDSYRRANTSRSWPGYALMLRLMKAEKYWAHDAFFDYVDRWMTEDNSQTAKDINAAAEAAGKSWRMAAWMTRDTRRTDAFVQAMWDKYRPTLDAPIDGWKLKE
ncbi:MAG TPA: hypothetical protein VNA25_20475 [Phycisphaerae bacterium]|nr:hypothetical protein [Phycisphaerae bacterium]